MERPASGLGPETILIRQFGDRDRPTTVSHDGRWLVFMEATPLHSVIALRSREDLSKVVRIEDRETERDGSISPDGRWLLYSSIPATRREVLVQSVPKEAGGSPNAVGKWQISTAGGSQPAWRGDEDVCGWWRARGGRCGYVLDAEVVHASDRHDVEYPAYTRRKLVEIGAAA